ncbi:putative membrane protein YccC [Collimonas sp. PA-H2]|uniref:FUSC family protein n=1 Tax=Collimonas sp. PA-H2 TaxID=1881062 RepID=UPI000BF3B74F|nr:FUSC family protein [Collimonas sp. PA-H2]PFH08852.1 putative membrane protein YccC [Collimonas sp. PA-H2]
MSETASSRQSWPHHLAQAGVIWVENHGQDLLHVSKVLLASLLALGLSLLFDLSKPGTAMVTVIIVLQPRSGLVLAKGFYRFIGTAVGVIVSIILAASFTQQPVLFLAAGACWLAFCTAGSTIFRNFQSYAFVLAGYTLVIVGLPAALQPAQAFDIAMTRLSEVMLGLLCAGVVSDVLFPKHLSDVLLLTVRKRFADFKKFIALDDSAAVSRPARERMVLRFIGEVISLEALRTSSVFESASGHLQSLQLRQLNTAFMTASTTFHSLDQLFGRLQAAGKHSTLDALMMEYRAIVRALSSQDRMQLKQVRNGIPGRLAALRRGLAASSINSDGSNLLDFDSATELLARFADELLIYARIHAIVIQAEMHMADDVQLPAHYVARTDPTLIATSALRAAIGFILSAWFWIQTGWVSGTDAVVMATVVSALFAAAPSPIKVVRQFMIGGALGGFFGFLSAYYLQAQAENFTMLCIALAPFILIGAWLTTTKKYSGIGTGILLFFLSYASIGSNYQFDMLELLNGMTGGLFGVAIASVMYQIIDPSDSRWIKRRLARALRNQVVEACNRPLPGLAGRFESGTRDLLARFAITHSLDNEDDRAIVTWLLSVLEIGRAVIQLRQETLSIGNPEVHGKIEASIGSIAFLFARPSQSRLRAALDAVLAAIAACAEMPAVLANLHLMRGAMLERVTVLTPAETTMPPSPLNPATDAPTGN